MGREAFPSRYMGTQAARATSITIYKVILGRKHQLDGLTRTTGHTTQDRDDTTDSTDMELRVSGSNLQARKLVEQSLTETEESGKVLSRVSMLARTRPDMHEQSRSERPQSKQHARLILL